MLQGVITTEMTNVLAYEATKVSRVAYELCCSAFHEIGNIGEATARVLRKANGDTACSFCAAAAERLVNKCDLDIETTYI